jgi:photosystem II stability/assembly factor-like uncharacterized protein
MSVQIYRTKDGLADYAFSLEPQRDGTWRAYIVRQPSYGGRATDSGAVHRLSDGGRHYVCWQGAIRSESEARAVARDWADLTQRYIRFGDPFGR